MDIDAFDWIAASSLMARLAMTNKNSGNPFYCHSRAGGNPAYAITNVRHCEEVI